MTSDLAKLSAYVIWAAAIAGALYFDTLLVFVASLVVVAIGWFLAEVAAEQGGLL